MNVIIQFVRQLKVWQKLAVITFTLVVPIVILGFLLSSDVSELSTFVKKELDGVEYLQPLAKVEQLVPQHRGQTFALQNGDQTMKDQILNTQKELDEAIKAVDAVDAKLGSKFATSDKWKQIKDKWLEVKNVAPNTKADDVYKRHTDLMAAVLGLAGDVGDVSNLIYDPVNISYALQDNIVYRIPTLVEHITQARDTAAGIIAKKKMTPAERDRLVFLKGKIEASRELVAVNFALINAKGSDDLKKAIENNFNAAATATDNFLIALDKNILEPKEISPDAREVWDIGTRAVDTYLGAGSAYEATVPALKTILANRLAGYNRTQYYAILAIIVGTGLALGLVYVVARGIARQAQTLQETFSRIGIGDFDARAEQVSDDELGAVALAMNSMLDNTMNLIQSREEKDAIQTSIMKLLDEVSGVGDGDLTKEAEVTADVMGAVADSFNYMISQLRDIIGNVQKSTRLVTGTANEIVSNTQQLAAGSETQATQIVSTSAAVEQMAMSAKQVSDNASISATVAQQALVSAKAGNDAVKNTIAGMDRIRDQVQETAKRIKRLGESSQEIGQIIQLIEDIADRTSILALNASIQAAMAGDAGRGFAVVAEEVERLADRSTDATKKIGTLVKTIQSETNEAVAAMEKGIQEVVDGSRLASQAGNSLGEIESVSNKLAELIQTISVASKQQAQASESVTRAMADISDITRETADGTKQAANAVSSLARLAQELRSSVAQFKIPGGDSSSQGASLISDTNGWHGATEKTNSRF